jgi:hypothetical protein
VALSRATNLKELFLTKLDFRAIRADREAIEEYRGLEARAIEIGI